MQRRSPARRTELPTLSAWLVLCALPLSACGKDITVGKQCPAPASGRAEVRGPETVYQAYGVTCAPCDDDDEPEFDDDGCPVYVTFESCGGDICIGRTALRRPPDAGPPDASADEDSGGPDPEDGGAEDGGAEDSGA